MGAFTIGDTGCTTGGSSKIYTALKAASGSGIVSPLVAGSAADKALQALAYSISKGIGDEITADGGLGSFAAADGSTLLSYAGSDPNLNDTSYDLKKFGGGSTGVFGLTALSVQVQAAGAVAAGATLVTLPSGWIPYFGSATFEASDGSGNFLKLEVTSSGALVTRTSIPAGPYYFGEAVFKTEG